MTLSLLLDVVGACHARADRPPKEGGRGKAKEEEDRAVQLPAVQRRAGFAGGDEVAADANARREAAGPRHLLAGAAGQARAVKPFEGLLQRTKAGREPLKYSELLRPGTVSVVDLSDSGMSELNNLVIADLLRGVQDAQDDAYSAYEKAAADAAPPPRVLIVIEEAHEFLSAERIDKMRHPVRASATIARRGRKRWLGLAFVTQLPQHLPRQISASSTGTSCTRSPTRKSSATCKKR